MTRDEWLASLTREQLERELKAYIECVEDLRKIVWGGR